MTCNYCGSRLGDEEHRCGKCGRRPDDTLSAEMAVHGALAMQRRTAPQLAPARPVPETGRPSDFTYATQARFAFQDRPALKVVPFDSFAPARSETRRPVGPGAASKAGPKAPSSRTPRQRGVQAGQGTLDFLPPAPAKPKTLGTTVDAVIFCEAPVAARLHRAIAAALDWALVLIAFGLFLAMFRLLGGHFFLNRTTLPIFAGDLALIAVAYGFVWVLAGSETAGMRWTRLRLITFDGFPPDTKQRLARFAGSCLSVCTVIGLIWSLGDEESLTWQDHISRTFPTPCDSDKDVLRRR
jgi:uncharacterized RDD family membrane protein YckC